MNLMLIGGGGREHAILRSLKKNPAVETVWMLPGNGAMESEAICTGIGATDLDGIVAFAKANKGDYAVVAKNRDRIYQREFKVVAGRNQDVEVLAVEEESDG